MNVLMQYRVGEAAVQVVEDASGLRYVVYEPPLPEEGLKVLVLMKDYFLRHPDKSPLEPEHRWLAAEVLGLTEAYDRYQWSIDYYLKRDVAGYGRLDVVIRDELVEEIGVNGPGPVMVVHRDFEGWMPTNIVLRDRGEVLRYALILAQRSGESVSPAFPIREFRLPEGHRVTVAIDSGGVARETTITIRKFPEKPLSLEDLVARRMLSPKLAALLELVVLAKGMVLIVGPQGSGKTTLVGALLDRVPPARRIVTVEEVPELRLRHSNWVALYPRDPAVLDPAASRTRVGLRKLLRAALRMRSDYVAVAEARGPEVKYIFEAAALGSGSLATFHAGGLEELERRLRLLGIGEDLLDLVWLVVVTSIVPGRGRRVVAAYSREEEGWSQAAQWSHESDSWQVEVPDRLLLRISAGLGVDRGEVLERLEAIERELEASAMARAGRLAQ